ncbi:MAG: hypothetical protein LBG05_07585, partial [Treponema sp.]|nr:hypothetical protein [Treponema sp.]
YTVSFVVLFDLISKTLEPGQTTSVGIDDGFHGFKSLTIPLETVKGGGNLVNVSADTRVEYKQKGNTITFTDITPITLEVFSPFDVNVTLRAGYYMEYSANGSLNMTVLPSVNNTNNPNNINNRGAIYTKTPTFSAYYGSYPVTVNYTYTAATNIMRVTVH